MDKTIKLNIGCGSVGKKGYLGVDARKTPATNFVAEAWNLADLFDGTVDEVYSRHMLEHLEPGDARKALIEWHRVLKSDGVLNVIMPDLRFHCQQLLDGEDAKKDFEWAMAGFYGWKKEERGGTIHDAHKWGYTEKSLTRLLNECGYEQIYRRVHGVDSEPWHLNMRAIRR
jgi:ubiquinone/menaquinone biosynthesis C-methylase UbiE